MKLGCINKIFVLLDLEQEGTERERGRVVGKGGGRVREEKRDGRWGRGREGEGKNEKGVGWGERMSK